jgi:hypothetical protein
LDYDQSAHNVSNAQHNSHFHNDDWARTVHIDTLGVSMTDFVLSHAKKKQEYDELNR